MFPKHRRQREARRRSHREARFATLGPIIENVVHQDKIGLLEVTLFDLSRVEHLEARPALQAESHLAAKRVDIVVDGKD